MIKDSGPAADAWRLLKELVAKRPRAVIVSEKPGYHHAQYKGVVFGFVDDLEFYLGSKPGCRHPKINRGC